MSIYCTGPIWSDSVPEEGYQPPLVYRESHLLPAHGDQRGGELQLAYIPGFITRNGLDVAGDRDPEHDHPGVWPWLRVVVEDGRGPVYTRPMVAILLDRAQVGQLRDELTEWMLRCDDPYEWLRRRSEQIDYRVDPIAWASTAEDNPKGEQK